MGETFCDLSIKNNIKTYEDIRTIATGQGDHYTTGHLLDYPYFKENYKLIAIDLSKQQVLDAYPKAIKYLNYFISLIMETRAPSTKYSTLNLKESKRSLKWKVLDNFLWLSQPNFTQ